METVIDHTFGLAMYLAADYAINLEWKRGHGDPKNYQAALKMTDADLIVDYIPYINEELQECNEEIIEFCNYFQDMEDAQINLFEPTKFIELCSKLFNLVRKAEFTAVCAIQEQPYWFSEDHDTGVGALIDPAFLLTFHEKMSQVKNPKVWHYGSFFCVADFTL